MLDFVKNAFRGCINVLLWINLILCTIGGGVSGYYLGQLISYRNAGGYAFVGVIIGIIWGLFTDVVGGGFIVTILNMDENIEEQNSLLRDLLRKTVSKETQAEKKCPFCAEEIKSKAKICPHCNKNIEEYELKLKNKEEENSKIKIQELKDKKINIEELLVDDMDNFFLNISKTDNLISFLKFIYENSDHSDDLRIKESNIIKKYGDKLYPIISNWAVTVYRGCTMENIDNNKNLILNAIKKELPYYFNILKSEIK